MERTGDTARGLIVGGAVGALTGGLSALLAARPALAAPENEKLEYLIQLGEANLQLTQAVAAALSVQLEALNTTMKSLLEITGLDFAFDPMRYVAWKLRSGEAYADRGSYYQLLGPGATFTGTFIMPEGYVWVGIREGVTVSQNGVIELTRTVDGAALPWMYVPRLVTGEFNWAETLPFGFVIRQVSVVTYTNHDLVNQWLVGGYFGIYLRKDVWERDSKVMDLAAAKYTQPPEVL